MVTQGRRFGIRLPVPDGATGVGDDASGSLLPWSRVTGMEDPSGVCRGQLTVVVAGRWPLLTVLGAAGALLAVAGSIGVVLVVRRTRRMPWSRRSLWSALMPAAACGLGAGVGEGLYLQETATFSPLDWRSIAVPAVGTLLGAAAALLSVRGRSGELTPSVATELPGLGDRFRLRGLLGSGASGTVYAAWQPALGRPVAVKQLRASLVGDPAFLERFRQEARIMARLDHPNCVQVYDLIEADGNAYLISELVDGISLRRVAAAAGRLSPEQSLRVLEGALRGIAHIHRRGLVHRDLKPENILVDRMGTSRLIDVGLAAPAGESAAGSGLEGTLAYMSPEQMRGEPVDARSDLYSAGAVLFELLCGRPPHHTANPQALAAAVLHGPAPDVRSVIPELPEPVAALVRRALSRDPTVRQPDAEQFLVELGAAAADGYGLEWRRAGSAAAVAATAIAAGGLAPLLGGEAVAVAATTSAAGATSAGGGAMVAGTTIGGTTVGGATVGGTMVGGAVAAPFVPAAAPTIGTAVIGLIPSIVMSTAIAGGLLLGATGLRLPPPDGILPTASAVPLTGPGQPIGPGPPARYGAAMAYSPDTEEVVMYGGSNRLMESAADDTTPLTDTWLWNGDKWTQVASGTQPRAAAPQMAYDPVHHGVILVGFGADGTVGSWVWTGRAWESRPAVPPPPNGARSRLLSGHAYPVGLGFDAITRQLVLTVPIEYTDSLQGAANFIWTGQIWSFLSYYASPGPPGWVATMNDGSLAAFIDVQPTSRVVRWTGNSWDAPNGNFGEYHDVDAAVFDARIGKTVLVGPAVLAGPDVGPGASRTTMVAGDLRGGFTELHPIHLPTERGGAAAAYDAKRGTLVMFGGYSLGIPSAVAVDDTWVWDGSDWSQPLQLGRSCSVEASPRPSPSPDGAAGPAITGIVCLRSGGAPVQSASVTATLLSGICLAHSDGSTVPASCVTHGTSDASGRYRIPVEQDGVYRMRVERATFTGVLADVDVTVAGATTANWSLSPIPAPSPERLTIAEYAFGLTLPPGIHDALYSIDHSHDGTFQDTNGQTYVQAGTVNLSSRSLQADPSCSDGFGTAWLPASIAVVLTDARSLSIPSGPAKVKQVGNYWLDDYAPQYFPPGCPEARNATLLFQQAFDSAHVIG